MADDDKELLEDVALEAEEELLEEPAEPEEDEVKCEECAPCRQVHPHGWQHSLIWRRC